MSSRGEEYTCWLCEGTARIETRYSSVPLARCASCGFLFNPTVSSAQAHEIYDDTYFAEYPGGKDYESDPRQRAFEANLRVEWLLKYSSGGRLLEVGAANGSFLEAAAAKGFDVFGVEPAPDIARHAAERTGLQIVPGFIETVELPDEPFDVICAWEVLEHLTQPIEALRRLRAHAADDAVLLLEIPNIAGDRAKALGTDWFHLDPENHVGFFTTEQLGSALKQSGWSMTESYTMNDFLYRRPRLRFEFHAVAKLARDVVITRSLNVLSPHPTRHDLLRAVARAEPS